LTPTSNSASGSSTVRLRSPSGDCTVIVLIG
jgi:hypothetical protein